MAVGFVASASSGSQASVASFNIGTLGTGARAGIVFVATHNSATAVDTGVTWNGVSMTLLFSATDTNTEPGVVRAYFLDNVTNGTITVSRTNNATVCVGYAASISATGATAVTQTVTVGGGGTVVINGDASEAGTTGSGEVSVDDGSRGTDSMRFAAAFSGAATPPAQGTNSTNLQVLDSTAFGSRFVRETTAGQGSRSVGFATGTTDDWALVAVAVSEINVSATGAITGAAPVVDGTGSHVEAVTGTGTITGAAPTVAGTGTETFTATGALTVPAATVAGSGTETLTATGSLTVPSATVSGSGTHTESGPANPEGTGALTGTAPTVSGTGSLGFTATGSLTLPAPTVSGAGLETIAATAVFLASAPVVAGAGVVSPIGTGALVMPSIAVSGSGQSTGGTPTGGHGGRISQPPRLPDPDEDEAYVLLL